MPKYDALYHRLFSHAVMVEQLLRDFVDEPWIAELDLTRLERVNGRFDEAGEDGRNSDIGWRVPLKKGGDAYLVLLLEFQSRRDRWMALRVLVYTGLLWQHIVKEKRLPRGGKLPPVFPIVLYNGRQRWRKPKPLAELIGLPPASPLWSWQPSMRFHLIDEGAFGDADLARRKTLTAMLFRLENPPKPEQIKEIVAMVIGWFQQHDQFDTLRSEFAALIRRAVASATDQKPDDIETGELADMQSGLLRTIDDWKRQWKREGLQEGRQEGRREGEAAMLIRQLGRRFGPLAPTIERRIAEANATQLEEWSLRLLDAETLDQVIH